jgi:hypothetical protein
MPKKSKKKVSGLAFNALGIVFILGVLPLMVAFVSNASGINEGDSQSIMPSSIQPTMTTGDPYFEWVNNGENVSDWYKVNHPPTSTAYNYYNCLYIKEGLCQAYGIENPTHQTPSQVSGMVLATPYAAGNLTGFDAYRAQQTHADGVASVYFPSGIAYRGGSGDGHFTFKTYGAYYDLDPSQALGDLKLSMVDASVTYAEDSTIFENISFKHKAIFEYEGQTLVIDMGIKHSTNRLCYEILTTSWATVCTVGLEVVFELTSFESHHLQTLNNGDYYNTSITFDFYDFDKENGQHISGTALPFTGVGEFAFGLETSMTDTQNLSFIVKGGSLVIGLICIGVAVASTPYWDPMKNALTGAE